MRNSKAVKIVALLVGMFVAAPFIFGQMERPRFERGGCHEFMIQKLNLTEEQQETIDKLRFKHQEAMIDLRSDIERKKLEMNELKRSGNYSREDFIAKVKAISDAKEKIALMRANHRMDIYELLTDDQKKEFNKLGKPFCENRKHFRQKRFNRDF